MLKYRLVLLTAAAALMALSTTASAKGLRTTKKQKAQIAVAKRKIQRSKLDPAAKNKVLKAISRAENKLKTSSDPHLRLHTSSNRYESTLVFGTGGSKSLTVYFRPQKGGDVKVFQEFGNSRQIFRARSLSPDLTIAYRGRVDYKNNNTISSAYRLMTSKSKRPAFLTEKLWKNIYYGGKGRELIPQLETVMLGKPRGLDLSRGKVRVAPNAPRRTVEVDNAYE
ncbi:MAG: hypothetical protein KJO07_25310 [Deltaproteobacteria bacterium]|nr:hypothetical protein [Deltaproteobacteria bacterium]